MQWNAAVLTVCHMLSQAFIQGTMRVLQNAMYTRELTLIALQRGFN